MALVKESSPSRGGLTHARAGRRPARGGHEARSRTTGSDEEMTEGPSEFTALVKARAAELGFDLAGVATAEPL